MSNLSALPELRRLNEKKKKQVRNLTKPENAHEKSMVSRAKNLSAQNILL